jgi:hypothetical protein
MKNQETIFKVEYKILYNRDAMQPNAQNRIAKTKDYLDINFTKETPYFVSIGFVGGECVKEANATFNVCIFIKGLKARYDLNTYILECWKDAQIYIFENNAIPYLLQG